MKTRRATWVTPAVCGLALLAVGSPASAMLEETFWDLQLNMSGAAAKVTPTKGTLPCRLTFDYGTFSLSPGFSGTFATDGTGTKATLSPDLNELAGFLTAQLEAAGAAQGVDVESVTVGKVSGVVTAKRGWGSLDLTVSLKVSYTVSATVAGKAVVGSKGSLSLSAKASNPALGTGQLLAGSEWNLNTKDTVKASSQGHGASQSGMGFYWLYVGPNATQGLASGEFIEVDDYDIRWGGTYQLDPKRPKIVFNFTDAEMEQILTDLLLSDLPAGAVLDSVSTTGSASATVSGSSQMKFAFNLSFTVYVSYAGESLKVTGKATSSGPGVRLDAAARVGADPDIPAVGATDEVLSEENPLDASVAADEDSAASEEESPNLSPGPALRLIARRISAEVRGLVPARP